MGLRPLHSPPEKPAGKDFNFSWGSEGNGLNLRGGGPLSLRSLGDHLPPGVDARIRLYSGCVSFQSGFTDKSQRWRTQAAYAGFVYSLAGSPNPTGWL